MRGGIHISTWDIPKAFWIWFDKIRKDAGYATIEWSRQTITVVRTRTPVESERAMQKISFGKIVCDSSGTFLERTYKPKYFSDDDLVRSV